MSSRLLRSILRSAWPKPSIDRLLRAAMIEDPNAAAAAWREFETSADFDHLTASEMWLIGLGSKRLSMIAPDSPMRARMEGIGRANWSRSQLTIGEAGVGLRALQAASIDMLAIKDAGQIAVGGPTAYGRLVTGIEVVVPPGDFERAFDLLASSGWRPPGAGTVIHHRSVPANVVSTNFTRGKFGNLTLRRTPFRPRYMSLTDDASIWRRSAAGNIGYATVRVPSATDAVVIALSGRLRDAHKSGDWLVDIAAGIDSGMDWELFKRNLERRGLDAPGAVALRYVYERLGRPIPQPVLARLERSALRHPAALVATLVKTHLKSNRTVSTF